MSVTTLVPSRLNASEGRRIAPRKSARSPRYSRKPAFCLSSVKWLVTRARMPPGFSAVDGLGEEEVVQRQLHAAVVEPDIGKRRVADHGVDLALGELRVAKALDADVGGPGAARGRSGRRGRRAPRR